MRRCRPPAAWPASRAPVHLLNQSVVAIGEEAMVGGFLQRLCSRQPVTIVGIGSSISARHGGCSHSLLSPSVRDGCCAATCSSNYRGWLRSFFDGLNETRSARNIS